MDDDDLEFDPFLDSALMEQAAAAAERQAIQRKDSLDDFGDDLDVEALAQATDEAVQQQQISFVSNEPDPHPPALLPEDTPCFHRLDFESVRTWIYPTNYPIRGYQLNIVQKAMFNNTLVSLPTGLGKTFIAAVVMYNYYRWFPSSKIIFMAPTRPLVAQQIEACFEICGLPQQDTVDIAGQNSNPAKRIVQWREKRVFFSTPQTVENDLLNNACPAEKVVCVVVDEAHKATGEFAYTKVIKLLMRKNTQFRVLALTATPGSKMDAVQNVVDNLKINNIQIRTEDSMDVRQFNHGKDIQKIIVPLTYSEGGNGIVPRVREDFKRKVFQPMIDSLHKRPIPHVISADAESIATFGLTSARKLFAATANNISNGLKFSTVNMFLVAEHVSRAYDMLSQHGIASFVETIEAERAGYAEKIAQGKNLNSAEAKYNNDWAVKNMLEYLKREMAKPDFVGHPKIDQLVSVLLKHFTELPEGAKSKVMIFSSYRSSVIEIARVLDQHKPILRCSLFVGQADGKNGAKGLKQFEQQEVISKFKKDDFNILISTSIGEEGLDIGEVDLIVCYDSQSSPIRMLQRIGRTGRKRRGKVVLLLTEQEEKRYNQAKESYARIQRQITHGGDISYYRQNPSIIPQNYRPTICRKKLQIGIYIPKAVTKRKRDLVAAPTVDLNFDDGILTDLAKEIFTRSFNNDLETFQNIGQVYNRYWPLSSVNKSAIGKYIPLQTTTKPTYRISHSTRTVMFTKLVDNIEKRILYPGEKQSFTLPKATTQRKNDGAAAGPCKLDTFFMPKKSTKKKQTRQDKVLDDAFADFMQQNDFTNFIDPADFEVDETIMDSATSKSTISKPTKDKGKGKAVELLAKVKTTRDTVKVKAADPPTKALDTPANSVDALANEVDLPPFNPSMKKKKTKRRLIAAESDDDDFELGFRLPVKKEKDKSVDQDRLSWEPILPENMFDDSLLPLEDRHPSTFQKLRSRASIPPMSPIDNNMDTEPTNDEVIDDIEFDDSFVFADSIMDEQEAFVGPTIGFDDPLEPLFPFETEQDVMVDSLTIVWAETQPKFSAKALEVLDQRQQQMKEMMGKFVTMQVFKKYSNSSTLVEGSLSSQQNISKRRTVLPPTPVKEKKMISPANSQKKPVVKPASPAASPIRKIASPVAQQQKVASPLEQQQKRVATTQDSLDDDEFVIDEGFFDQLAALEPTLNQTQDKKPTYDIPQQDNIFEEEQVLDDLPEEELPQEEDNELDFNDIDFNEGTFANFLENKFDDGELSIFENPLFLRGPDSQPASQMKDKAAIYSQKKETVIEMNFDISSSEEESSQKSAVDLVSVPDSPPFPSSPQPIASPGRASVQHSAIRASPLRNSIIQSPVKDNIPQLPYKSPTSLQKTPFDNSPIQLLRELSQAQVLPSPLRQINESESEDTSPFIIRRKRPIFSSPLDDSPPKAASKKRLKRKSTSTIVLDDDDFEEIAPPSSSKLLQKLKQSQGPRQKSSAFAENPFLDIEAEQSDDEQDIPRSDDDIEEDDSLMNSFIDDEDGSALSIGPNRSLLNERVSNKHWINRFDADKWMNINTEEDDVVVTDDESEEPESIQEFSSLVQEKPEIDDDDDFM